MTAPAASPGDARPTALAVVPARLGSTRLPRKMLLKATGRYLFQETVENVGSTGVFDRVVVATDADEVLAAAAEVGIQALMTSPEHESGTDRVHEAVGLLAERGEGPWDVVVNVQGDEPELGARDLASLVRAFRDPEVEIATLWTPLTSAAEARDPSAVKVVLDARGDALYFSRSPIPCGDHPRAAAKDWHGKRHVGVYAFRPDALAEFTALPRGELEERECLEQLRWLEAGRRIRVLAASQTVVGIDTAEDYALFVGKRERPNPAPAERAL